jgi:hypothetical protein
MVVQSGSQAVANANRYTRNQPGMCLMYVHTWLDIGAGTPSAIAAWNAARHKHINGVHADAQHPPRGAPVFWAGGSRGFGHIALAVNDHTGRSTDTPSTGFVGTRDGNWWRVNWGLRYLGWTEDLNGVSIPYLAGGGVQQWASGEVYVKKLHKGQKNSDSVARLCYRLMHHSRIPAQNKPRHQNNDYGKDIEQAVRFWQRQVVPRIKGPDDGGKLSNDQANALFGDNYTVIEK